MKLMIQSALTSSACRPKISEYKRDDESTTQSGQGCIHGEREYIQSDPAARSH